MKITFHPLLIIVLLYPICIISSCTSKGDICPEVQTFTQNLTAAEKSKIPYTGTDTLVFVSNTGDTLIYMGQGKQVGYETLPGYSSPPGCEQDKYNHEMNSIEYTPLKGESMLKVSLLESSSKLNIIFFTTTFQFYSFAVDDPRITDYPFYPNIILNNQTFHGVTLIYNGDGSSLYYNMQYGILQIKLANSQVWNRL